LSTCVIEASSNLVNWVSISTNIIPLGGSLTLVEPCVRNQPCQFYRVAAQALESATYVHALSGILTPPFISASNYLYQPNETALSDAGRAVYNFTIDEPGLYVIQAVVNALGEGANSFFVNIDGEPTDPDTIWDIPLTSGLEPRIVSWRGGGTFDRSEFVPKVFNLDRGSHQLIICGREAVTLLRDLVILPYPGVRLPVNSGTITAPFVVSNYVYWPGGHYRSEYALYQPAETSLAGGGRAVYNFTLDSPGNYVIQATVNAPNAGANSFFVSVDAQPQDPEMVWDIPLTSGFQSRLVSWRGSGDTMNDQFVPKIFSLAAGPHYIVVGGREAITFLRDLAVLPHP
jgi:hypothetical protein